MDTRVQITDRELALLKEIAGKGKVIVEVGCYAGKATVALADNNKIIAIDPLIANYDPKDGASNDMDGVEELFKSRIKGKSIVWHKKKSEEVLKEWDAEIGGVFIDGEHTTEALAIDLGWIKYVKNGGFLAFHDYGFFDEVTNLIDKEIRSKYEEIGRERFLIIFRKQ